MASISVVSVITAEFPTLRIVVSIIAHRRWCDGRVGGRSWQYLHQDTRPHRQWSSEPGSRAATQTARRASAPHPRPDAFSRDCHRQIASWPQTPTARPSQASWGDRWAASVVLRVCEMRLNRRCCLWTPHAYFWFAPHISTRRQSCP